MKVVFPLYHDMAFQSRPQECAAALHLLGADEIVMVTIAPWENCPPYVRTVVVGAKGSTRYFSFLSASIKAIKKERPDIVMLHDNYTAPILRWLVKRRYHAKTVFDSSELYIDPPVLSGIKKAIFEYVPKCEKKYLRYADVVIAANAERAGIMKDYYGLDKTPLVLENMRRLDGQPDTEACDRKYGRLFGDSAKTVLYGGGVKKARRTLELVRAAADTDGVRLIVAGSGTPDEVSELDRIAQSCEPGKIVYLGQVPRLEWKYLITRSDICVSIYAQDTYNNKYCASGRFYEGILEGKPALCTCNPPMKNACDKYGFGVSSEDLGAGLRELIVDYERFRQNAVSFAGQCRYEDRIPELSRQIAERLGMQVR